eukprot:579311-Rhodomonas_salina.4
MKTASCQPCEGCFQKETQAGDRQRSGGEKYNADGNRGENEKAGKQRGDKGGGDEDISVVALQSASCSPASHKLGFSMRTTLVQMAILVLVLGVCNVAGQEPELEPELLQTKPIYTGLLRTIGGGTSHVVSFDPSVAKLMLKTCMREGEAGRRWRPCSPHRAISGADIACVISRPGEEDGLPDNVDCLAEYKEHASSSKSNPVLGGQAFDPINQFWFHANGEDG